MRSLSLLFFCIISQQAYSSGFSLSEQNAIDLGNAFAGAAAVAEKASTIYSNPAGMVHVKGQQLPFAIHAINPSSSVQNTGSVKAGPAPLGNDGGDIGDLALLPSIYYSSEINPALFMGIGISIPFGL
jgi:long-chain fatty acid transport protein